MDRWPGLGTAYQVLQKDFNIASTLLVEQPCRLSVQGYSLGKDPSYASAKYWYAIADIPVCFIGVSTLLLAGPSATPSQWIFIDHTG
jgi:hypothetical protein